MATEAAAEESLILALLNIADKLVQLMQMKFQVLPVLPAEAAQQKTVMAEAAAQKELTAAAYITSAWKMLQQQVQRQQVQQALQQLVQQQA